MTRNFSGTIEVLENIIEATGLKGEWKHEPDKHVFKVTGKKQGVITWYPTTTNLQFQGSKEIIDQNTQKFDSIIQGHNPDELTSATPLASSHSTLNSQQIFIVHGHDQEARDQLELCLRRLGLEPFILMNSSGEGKTIIEALEGKIGKDFSSAFGIVLMTPDDMGYALKDGEEKADYRARQNVILEAGMLLSSLTRDRIAFIVKGHLELPSDLQGIIHLGYNDHINQVVNKLVKRLYECGFELDPDNVSAASI